MAKTETRFNFSQATDAEFRAWVAAVIADMLTVGLVASSDTGQIDTSTVLVPSAANQVRGFWMGKLNDGLTDILIKVEFGSGSQGAANPAMFFTLGWTTDGAGNFVGNTTSRWRLRFANTNNGATAYMRTCKVGSAFVMSYNEAIEGSNANNWLVCVDRYRDAVTGAPNATGAIMIGMARTELNSSGLGAVAGSTIAFPASNTQWEVWGNGLISPFMWTTSTWSRGSRLGVGTLCAWDSGATQPTIGLMSTSGTDTPTSTTYSVSMYGSSHVYRCVGNLSTIQNTGDIGLLGHIWE